MARLDIERQHKLEPKRMDYAQEQIEKLGYKVTRISDNLLRFEFKGSTINFFPYSGWATGATIKDGRGLKNLLKQLKENDMEACTSLDYEGNYIDCKIGQQKAISINIL